MENLDNCQETKLPQNIYDPAVVIFKNLMLCLMTTYRPGIRLLLADAPTYEPARYHASWVYF